MSNPYRVMCLETCEIQGVKFYEGVTYTATFPLEGQTYYFPDGNYPHCINGVKIWGVDALKFEAFMGAVEFEEKKPITIKLGNTEVSQVQPIGFPVHFHKLPEFGKFDPRYTFPKYNEAHPPRDTMLEAYALESLSELTGKSLKELARRFEKGMWNG